ncbi:MAG: PhnD/SsuA/transferrin family substrate-binding protein [Pseudomonadota bacterium]
MIAAMQMYDWPEVQGTHDAFWAVAAEALRDAGINAPPAMTRFAELSGTWARPDLLVGQTCGLPFSRGLCGDAVPFARGDYRIEGATGGTYTSAIIVRRDGPDALEGLPDKTLSGMTAAVNEWGSQSGCNALADAMGSAAGRPQVFGGVKISGSHRQSATLVADGAADIAALDAVAWDLYSHLEPARRENLKAIGWTRPMPALPFITAPANLRLAEPLATALAEAARQVSGPGLPRAILPADADTYAPVREMDLSLKGAVLAPGTRPF